MCGCWKEIVLPGGFLLGAVLAPHLPGAEPAGGARRSPTEGLSEPVRDAAGKREGPGSCNQAWKTSGGSRARHEGTSRTAGESKGEGALRSVGKGQREGELSSPALSALTHSPPEPSLQQGPELLQETET